MKEQIISHKVAIVSKEKGFNINVEDFYDNKILSTHNLRHKKEPSVRNPLNWNAIRPHYYSAPTKSFLRQWLRKKHFEIVVRPYGACDRVLYDVKVFYWPVRDYCYDYVKECGAHYRVYEEALEEGLLCALNEMK